IQSTPIGPGWLSARWTFEQVPGTGLYLIRNVWQRNEYLNIESGALTAGPIQPGWDSARWTIHPAFSCSGSGGGRAFRTLTRAAPNRGQGPLLQSGFLYTEWVVDQPGMSPRVDPFAIGRNREVKPTRGCARYAVIGNNPIAAELVSSHHRLRG